MGRLVEGVDLVAVLDVSDVARVYYGRCQHRGALLPDGHMEGEHLVCTLHGSTYDGLRGARKTPFRSTCRSTRRTLRPVRASARSRRCRRAVSVSSRTGTGYGRARRTSRATVPPESVAPTCGRVVLSARHRPSGPRPEARTSGISEAA
ncbi:Rieske (2Fe-2S) protein [Nesterenkonia lacusekhoensis]|uniref:Rieske (2Fe-2S) protein n=1 Tax=Nesterenkonia lacusekhoensis TaxID=150832 RepID=UPI0036156FC0